VNRRTRNLRLSPGTAAKAVCAAILLWSLGSWAGWIWNDVRLTGESVTTSGLIIDKFYDGNSMAGEACGFFDESSTGRFYVVYSYSPTGAGGAEDTVIQTEEISRGLYCRLTGGSLEHIHYLPAQPPLATIDRYWYGNRHLKYLGMACLVSAILFFFAVIGMGRQEPTDYWYD
jgi:hypothetical protein